MALDPTYLRQCGYPDLSQQFSLILDSISTPEPDAPLENPIPLIKAVQARGREGLTRDQQELARLQELERLIEQEGEPPNIVDPITGQTALIAAVLTDQPTLVDYLKDWIYLNIQDKEGKTAFHYLVEREKIEQVNLLLEYQGSCGAARVNLNIQDNQGNTPLHIAVSTGNKDLISLLINSKAKFLANKEGNLPQHLIRTMDIFEIFNQSTGLDRFAQQNNEGLTPIHAIYLKSKQAEPHIIAWDNTLDSQGQTPLFYIYRKAIEAQDPEEEARLLEIVQDQVPSEATQRNSNGDTLFHFTAQYGKVHIAESLKKMGLVLDGVCTNKSHDLSALDIAAQNNQVAMINWLHKEQAKYYENTNGEVPLHHAAAKAHVQAITCLINKHKHSIEQNLQKKTPLHCAVEALSDKNIQIKNIYTSVRLLLQCVDHKITAINNDGKTACDMSLDSLNCDADEVFDIALLFKESMIQENLEKEFQPH